MSRVRAFFSVPKFSLSRLAILLVPTLIIGAWLGYGYATAVSHYRDSSKLLAMLGIGRPTVNRLDARYSDADHDLVADPPSSPDKFVDPSVLVFASVPTYGDEERHTDVWKDFRSALSKATGKKVKQREFQAIEDQFVAFERGEVQLAMFNTGSVPRAVNTCGFVPICTYGHTDGTAGYNMRIIVPAASSIKSVPDLRGCRFAFVDRNSNSGFKLPVVLMKEEFDLLPGRDYQWGFTFAHETSIRSVAAGDYKGAAVASDILERESSEDAKLQTKIRSIYQSERFPPPAIGCAWNLPKPLVAQIRGVLLEFKISGTSLEQIFKDSRMTRFVPVSYKDDWALVRRIDNQLGAMRPVGESSGG